MSLRPPAFIRMIAEFVAPLMLRSSSRTVKFLPAHKLGITRLLLHSRRWKFASKRKVPEWWQRRLVSE